jgi:hypothetical protein
MNSFYLLTPSGQIAVSDQYAGYVIFYKKSAENSIAAIQENLFLKLIENGLKLKMEQFLFIDITNRQERISSLKKSIDIQKCFLFGVNEKQIGINFDIPLYTLTTVGTTEFLKADTPEVLEQEKQLKNQLWKQLQIAFKLI